MFNLSLFSGLIQSKPASDVEINEVEADMNAVLPNAYKDLLKVTNGFSTDDVVVIYGTDDIVERNETREINKYASGYVVIGDDSGPNVFLMRQHAENKEVLVVDVGYMNPIDATVIATDFNDWINKGCPSESEQNGSVEPPDICDIVLVEKPKDSLKDLLRIKNVFGIEISAIDLLEGSRNLPFDLIIDYPHGKAVKLINKLGHTGTVLAIQNERYF